MIPFVQYAPGLWIEDPSRECDHECSAQLLFSDEALIQLVAFNTQQIRQGLC